MELSTNYMGLELRNPLVASASPLSHTVDGVRRLADAGVGAVVLHSLFEEQLREEAELDARLTDAGTESFAESLSYFPSVAENGNGPRPYLSLLRTRRGRRRRPGDREPQLRNARRLDRVRARNAGRRRRRDRAQRLLPARRSDHSRPRRRTALRRRRCARQGRGHRAGRSQARPVLQLDRRDRAAAGRGRRRCPRPVQPLPAARYRPRNARRRALGRALGPGGRAAAADLDRAAARQGARRARGHRRASKTPPTWPNTCSLGRMW